MPSKTILAINPGTRYLGYAVFNGPDLSDWGMKAAQGCSMKQKTERIKKIVLGLINQYRPEVLAIKKLHPSRSSPDLIKLASELKRLAVKRRLRVHEYPITSMKVSLVGKKRMNKLQLAELLAQHYPPLYSELQKELSSKNSYHIRMFEAVALGWTCQREFDG